MFLARKVQERRGAFLIIGNVLFQKYKIISLLGEGDSSQVYLCEHLVLKIYRAVKCIRKDHTLYAQFLKEANLLKKLEHPGILQIYDIEEDEHFLYLIEEYVQGESLQAFSLRHHNISEEMMIQIGLQLCDIFQYLHSYKPVPILYLDLKPNHVFFCNGQLKMIDFGVAMFMEQGKSPSLCIGTPEFAAPEQGHCKELDVRTDIFAIAALLYYMICKESINTPIKDELFFEKMKYCSMQFCYIVKVGLSENPQDRQQTASELKTQLAKISKRTSQSNLDKTSFKVGIIGSQSRIGVTHIAIAIVCYFNQDRYNSMYREENETRCLQSIAESKNYKEEVIRYQSFQGIPFYGPGICLEEQTFPIQVTDYGVWTEETFKKLQTEEIRIYICGSKPWEIPASNVLLNRIQYEKDAIILFNFTGGKKLGELANYYKRVVFGFPLDESPFINSNEKELLFQKIFSIRRKRKKWRHHIFERNYRDIRE